MSELGARKFNAAALNEKEIIHSKRIKSDDSDSSTADTSSEEPEECNKLERMSNAIRTIIEVNLSTKSFSRPQEPHSDLSNITSICTNETVHG